jgi:CheY-like chemotaxis protein
MKTILAADDSAVILLYIEESLKDEGYNVISAKNGMKALELIENFNGIIEMYKDTPVIVLTSLTDESTIENAKLSGANCWINKPFEMGALLDAIKRLG